MSDILFKQVPKEAFPVHPSTIKFKTPFKNCILKSMKNRNWNEVDGDGEWDILWAEKDTIQEVLDRTHLGPNQKVNHFRNHFELTRKDHLMRNLKKHKRQLEKEGKIEEAAEYDFFPITYNLPTEYPVFCEEFKKNGNGVWIMKPIGRSQGKGIFLFNKLNQISNWKLDPRRRLDNQTVENYVVQKYISNPLLIGGKKFDLRIYCLVTSFSPLVAYFYRDGFARFTHHRYDNHDLNNACKIFREEIKTSENYDEKLGGKWNLGTLKQYLISKYGQSKVNDCFMSIQNLVIKTLQGVQKMIMNDKHCFELYGFDVLLDNQLKPWLLEVNGSPSMTANTTHDSQLKCGLLDDVFTILDFEKLLTGQEDQIGGFDLIITGNNPKGLPENSINKTMLGCLQDRKIMFTKLSKVIIEKHKKNKKTNTQPQSKSLKPQGRSTLKKAKENLGSSLIQLPTEKTRETPTSNKNKQEISSFTQAVNLSLSTISASDANKTPRNTRVKMPLIRRNIGEQTYQPNEQEYSQIPLNEAAIHQSKSETRLKLSLRLPKVGPFKIDEQVNNDPNQFHSQSHSKLLDIKTNTQPENEVRRALMPIKQKDEDNRRPSIPMMRPFSPWTTLTWTEKKGFDDTKTANNQNLGKTLTDSLLIEKVRSAPRNSENIIFTYDENHNINASMTDREPIKKTKNFRIHKNVKSKENKAKVKSAKSQSQKTIKKDEHINSFQVIQEGSTADDEEERVIVL